jgi:hypothetical protein
VAVLTEHRAQLDQLVALLLSSETVDGSEVYAIAGRPEPDSGAGMMVPAEHGSSADAEHPAHPAERRGERAPADAKAPDARQTTHRSG